MNSGGSQYLLRLPVLLAAMLSLVGCATGNQEPEYKITVFAAASLTDVVDSLAANFEVKYPETEVVHVTGGTSLLARQIIAGGNFDVFLSANEPWLVEVSSRGLLGHEMRLPVTNNLVVVDVRGSGGGADSAGTILSAAKRIAIADPSHVPAGIYARDMLRCLGIWEAVESQVVPMLDVRAALEAVRSGAVGASVVYSTDVYRQDMEVVQTGMECQPEVAYTAGLATEVSEAAGDFYYYVASDQAAGIWSHFGFQVTHD